MNSIILLPKTEKYITEMKTIGQYQLGDITEYKNPQQNSSKLNIAI